jgi:hypothetical protein
MTCSGAMKVFGSIILCIAAATTFAAARGTQGKPISSCSELTAGARMMYLPAAVIARTSLNHAAKDAVAKLPICAASGAQVFVRPTIVVHFFGQNASDVVRSQVVMYLVPQSIVQEASDIALHLTTGRVKHFPKSAVISTDSADDYEVFIVGPGQPLPPEITGQIADFVAP